MSTINIYSRTTMTPKQMRTFLCQYLIADTPTLAGLKQSIKTLQSISSINRQPRLTILVAELFDDHCNQHSVERSLQTLCFTLAAATDQSPAEKRFLNELKAFEQEIYAAKETKDTDEEPSPFAAINFMSL